MTPDKVVIYKDGWIRSRPWCADIVWSDGTRWRKARHGFRTLHALVAELDCEPLLENVLRVRGDDTRLNHHPPETA